MSEAAVFFALLVVQWLACHQLRLQLFETVFGIAPAQAPDGVLEHRLQVVEFVLHGRSHGRDTVQVGRVRVAVEALQQVLGADAGLAQAIVPNRNVMRAKPILNLFTTASHY